MVQNKGKILIANNKNIVGDINNQASVLSDIPFMLFAKPIGVFFAILSTISF